MIFFGCYDLQAQEFQAQHLSQWFIRTEVTKKKKEGKFKPLPFSNFLRSNNEYDMKF